MNEYSAEQWLLAAAERYFPGARFELDTLPEASAVSLKVFGSFPTTDFRDRRHLLCRAMRAAGYEDLYMRICIFQRTVA